MTAGDAMGLGLFGALAVFGGVMFLLAGGGWLFEQTSWGRAIADYFVDRMTR